MHQSIATINSPEFINLQPLELNPLMSACEIKVLYVGENRNHSYITKEVAMEMAKTLRGAPIVGYYKEEKKDFTDHGEVVYIDDEGIHFECKTTPYGFVSPDAKVWFKEYEDYDDFGNSVTREYLMTTGYLWTGQFPECNAAISQGKNQSMEIDEETLKGNWSVNHETGMEFFIINDAIFSKLCILGDDVEPCFEGANITAPSISTEYTMDSQFTNTLFNMIQDLKNFALKQGGEQMASFEKKKTPEDEKDNLLEEENLEDKEEEEEDKKKKPLKNTKEEKEKKEEEEASETSKEEEKEDVVDKEVEEKEEEEEEVEEEDEDKKKKTINAKSTLTQKYSEIKDKYLQLKDKYETLKLQYSEMESKYISLSAFKLQIDNEKKDALIKSFYMLSDEDKKDVIENKSKYSYDEIEAKLSVICFRKRVNFDLEDSLKNKDKVEEQKTPTMTFNIENTESNVPAWIQALKNARSKNN